MDPNPAPGFQRNPGHTIEIGQADGCVRVQFAGELLAETEAALILDETGYGPVLYLPVADIRMDLATRTDHSTHCPYKGDATYWSFAVGEAKAENAAWSYETPYDEVAPIRGYLAFYPARVDEIAVY